MPRILPNEEMKKPLRVVLRYIQTGRLGPGFMDENALGQTMFKSARRMNDAHQIEEVGEKLRGMMPWISDGKMVDKAKN